MSFNIKHLLRFFFLVASLIICYGCSASKELRNAPRIDELHQISLANTKKSYISSSDKDINSAVVVATYINNISKLFNSNEVFIIGIYLENDKMLNLPHLGENLNGFTLNGCKPLSIKKISYDSVYLKYFPFNNKWFSYYEIKFPLLDTSKLNLKYSGGIYSMGSLKFSKNWYKSKNF